MSNLIEKKEMNYIDKIAKAICEESKMPFEDECYRELGRLYAVLCLAKGTETTCKDVHDAWSAWQSETDPNHRSLIPFDKLSKEVQDLDQLYVDAIHVVTKKV